MIYGFKGLVVLVAAVLFGLPVLMVPVPAEALPVVKLALAEALPAPEVA